MVSSAFIVDITDSDKLGTVFYDPEIDLVIDTIKSIDIKKDKFKKLITDITVGSTPPYATYIKEGIPFVRVQNLTYDGNILLDKAVCIAPTFHKNMKRSSIKYNDILLTVTGATVGKVAVSKYQDVEFNINQNIAKICIDDKVIPDYVYYFLKSFLGRIQLYRNSQRQAQEFLNYGSIESIIIAYPEDKNIQKEIVDEVKKQEENAKENFSNFVKNKELSKEKFKELLFGLNKFDERFNTNNNYSMKNQEIIEAKRLDFEWNHPRHEQFQKRINKLLSENSNLKISNILSICDPYLGTIPSQYTDEGIPIIKVRNLLDGEIDLKNVDLSIPLFITNFEDKKIKKYDILTPSRGFGSIGKVDIFDNEIDCVCDNNINVLRIKKDVDFDPWYLLYYLRSELGQIQIERYTTGSTGQTQLILKDVKKIQVLHPPKIDDQIAISKEILNLEKDSFSSRDTYYDCIRKSENIFLEFVLGDKASIVKNISIYN